VVNRVVVGNYDVVGVRGGVRVERSEERQTD
jgi:hypothetical protein